MPPCLKKHMLADISADARIFVGTSRGMSCKSAGLAMTLGTTMDKRTSVGGEDEETNLSLANEKLREKKVGKAPCVLIF